MARCPCACSTAPKPRARPAASTTRPPPIPPPTPRPSCFAASGIASPPRDGGDFDEDANAAAEAKQGSAGGGPAVRRRHGPPVGSGVDCAGRAAGGVDARGGARRRRPALRVSTPDGHRQRRAFAPGAATRGGRGWPSSKATRCSPASRCWTRARPSWPAPQLTALAARLRAAGQDPAGGWPATLSTFTHVTGLLFVARARAHHPWNVVDALWTDPPSSTEQVLHPEKYESCEAPVTVDPSALPPLPGLGRPSATDVAGELVARAWLATAWAPDVAARSAAGWGGDRAALYGPPRRKRRRRRGRAAGGRAGLAHALGRRRRSGRLRARGPGRARAPGRKGRQRTSQRGDPPRRRRVLVGEGALRAGPSRRRRRAAAGRARGRRARAAGDAGRGPARRT